MKDNILCIFIMLFVSVTFNANAQKSPQGQFSVKGVLVDSLSNEGEPYSTIRISLKSNPAASGPYRKNSLYLIQRR